MRLHGCCHCGATRFAIEQDTLSDIAHCHCTICRRSSGALVMTWGTALRTNLLWLRDKPERYSSSRVARRYFCRRCGAQLAFEHDSSPATIDIAIGALDHPERFPAQRHIWATTRVVWLHLDAHLPASPTE